MWPLQCPQEWLQGRGNENLQEPQPFRVDVPGRLPSRPELVLLGERDPDTEDTLVGASGEGGGGCVKQAKGHRTPNSRL